MPIEKVVLNASPIIVLYKANMENILPQLFKDIIIPKFVFEEITKAGLWISDGLVKIIKEKAGE